MRLTELTVENFRAARDVTIPLSNFVCLTGENNAGKSTLLLALERFVSGAKLVPADFYDTGRPVIISLKISDICEEDWRLLIPEHAERLKPSVVNGALCFQRRFSVSDGKSEIGLIEMQPIDSRFHPGTYELQFKGLKGKGLLEKAEELFPEYKEQFGGLTTQAAIKLKISELAQRLPVEKKQPTFTPPRTGADFSIQPFLPEVIYIPAVKDIASDMSTGTSSSFGKVLSIVLDEILPHLKSEEALFEKLKKNISRIKHPDGTFEDNRLKSIVEIENSITRHVREGFANVNIELDIPPPRLETVLSGTRIFVDDGAHGDLQSKGDGLRRAVVFAVLRTYVELRAKKLQTKETPTEESSADNTASEKHHHYLLLFEEPELYLHPNAQRILFDALGTFAKDHHVAVSTHSPLFLGPDATATFVRLSKQKDSSRPKPYTVAQPVDLSHLDHRDSFQLICFENNNAAFFSKHVVLVEGDSDLMVFPHLAKIINADWVASRHGVAFIKTGGKNSFSRYQKFFSKFGIQVSGIFDLDILDDGFSKIDPTAEQSAHRTAFLNLISTYLEQSPPLPVQPNNDALRAAQPKPRITANRWM